MSFARLPIRLRLTLVFALASVALVAALGLGLHAFVGRAIDRHVRDRIDEDRQELAAQLARSGRGVADRLGALTGIGFAQVLAPDGRVVLQTPSATQPPVLAGARLARARRGEVELRLDRALPGLDEPTLLRAGPVPRGPLRGSVLVAGGSLTDREATLGALTTIVLVGGAIAVLLVSLAAYALCSLALAPVRAMTAGAEAIADELPTDDALPLPPADDEIRELGTTLNGLLARLGLLVRRQRALLADASHELRTPLAILAHELRLGLRGSRSPEELRAALASAEEEVGVLTGITDDLLTLSRADAGELDLRPEALDVAALLERQAERFAARAAALGRAVVVAPASGRVRGDRERVERALGNLLENALRHGDGPVELRAERAGREVTLVVGDRGAGLAPDLAHRAFERFARGSQGGQEGSGLGLPIVRAIAEAHGGRAELRAREGGGTEGRLALPAA